MFRLALACLLFFTPLFAKAKVVTLPCGCPEQDYCVDPDADRRALPGPVAGVLTSLKCCPGLWTVGAAALVVGGLAYLFSNEVNRSSGHAHSSS